MSNQPWTQNFNVEDLGSSYRGDLDPEKIVWLQIQRCNVLHSTGDEVLYGNAVMSLLINVPEDIRIEVEENEGQYHKSMMTWRSVKGYSEDPEQPFIINNKVDLDYDPNYRGRSYAKTPLLDDKGKETGEYDYKEVWTVGGSHQVSPIYRVEETWDYYQLQKMIMAALQNHGLTWKQERTEIFTGEEWDPAFDPPEEEEDERVKPQTD